MPKVLAGVLAACVVLIVAGVTLAIVIVANDDNNAPDPLEGVVATDSLETAIAGEDEVSEHLIAENNADPALPGTYVPPQGRGHFSYAYDAARPPRAFCAGVAVSSVGDASAPTFGPVSPLLGPPPQSEGCYSSNPPSSGQHLNVQRNVEVAPGVTVDVPPDPDVYPPDIEVPREAISHIMEHAGVFVGYHCVVGDSACQDVVERIEQIVHDRIDTFDDRVVMARDSDLPGGTIALASWTRVDAFAYGDFSEDRVVEFIDVHSCRFDPEGFC